MRLVVSSLTAALLLSLSGCKGNCRQLSEKLCDCAANTNERTSCLQRAANNESNTPPTIEEDAACAPFIDTCDCRLIDTQAGKERCGLARPSLDGGL